ncbi:MAG: TonB-dependent receptor [Capnocytophaga sp.]|nr:TonB-dependent receptor [Capnocytophaga sp.]
MERVSKKVMNQKVIWLLFWCWIPWAYSQNIQVTGTVISGSDNYPAVGASVMEQGTTNGTTTDMDGKFTLSVRPESRIEISYIGYQTAVFPANAVPKQIVLNEDLQQLDDVVVTGYRTERKADLTGAVTVVDTDDMRAMDENNPMKALQGRVAGMQVTSDGTPSGASTIRIRGIGTLNNNDPLYIIDGVPTTAGMHELNGNDIASIQILRDASAASIYGSRAANGVIVITTKKGSGKVKVNFDMFSTTSFHTNKIDVLSSEEYARVMWKAYVNSGIDPNSNNLGIVYDYTGGNNSTATLNHIYFPEYLDAAKTMRPANSDWFKEVAGTGFAQSYNLSVSSGSEHGNHFFSLGYYNNDGIVKYTDFERISLRLNNEYKLFGDVVSIGENFTLNRTSEVVQPDKIIENALIAVPFIPVRTDDGSNWGGPINGLPDRQNPARIVYDNRDNRYNYWRIFGNAYINIQPVENLNIRSSYGVDYGNYYKRSLQYSWHTGYLQSDKTLSRLEQAHWLKWTWTNVATYDFEIGKNRFETMFGTEMFKQSDINFSSSKEDYALQTPDYMWPDVGTGTALATGASTGYTLQSYFGKAGYVYDNKYLASVTMRYDGSSRFGKNNRWGTFPAFNLGWRVDQEKFLQDKEWLSELKLRFGWGQTGNQEMSNSAVYNIYITDYGIADPTWTSIWGTAYDLNGTGSGLLPSGFKRAQLANPDLKWETTTQTNYGIDFGFFDRALYGAVEYYIKDTKDILYSPGYAAIQGEGAAKWYNGAAIENKGLEFTLGYRGETNFGLTFDVTGNVSTNQNKVTYLPESVKNSYGGNGTTDNILGRPLGSLYGFVADGIFKSQQEVDQHVIQSGKAPGRIRYKDLNGDGEITMDDRTWILDPNPDFAYGLNINLVYGNFDFNMYFQGIYGNQVINQLKYSSDFWSVSDTRSNKGVRLLDAWDAVTNPNSDIPALSHTDTANEARFSSYYVEDGSYLKLRNIQLGYNIPASVIEKIRLTKFRMYLSAQNILQFSSKKFNGVDPENPAWGYPIPTNLIIGANISF